MHQVSVNQREGVRLTQQLLPSHFLSEPEAVHVPRPRDSNPCTRVDIEINTAKLRLSWTIWDPGDWRSQRRRLSSNGDFRAWSFQRESAVGCLHLVRVLRRENCKKRGVQFVDHNSSRSFICTLKLS